MTPAQHARFRQQMMTHLQLQQQQHYLREQITLRERREAAAAATWDAGIPPRFTYPSYAPMQERDLGGAPETPTRDGALKPVPSHWQSPAREEGDDGERTRREDARMESAEPATATNDANAAKPDPVPHRRAAAAAARSAVSSAHAAGALDARGCAGAFVATVRRRGAGAFAATGRRRGRPSASASAPPRRVTFADRDGRG